MNKTLTIIAIGFLIINLFFFKNAETLNGGRAMIYIFIFPLFWILTLITVGILAYKNRKEWFSNEMKVSTIILLILCTPLSIWGFSSLARPEMELSGTSYNPRNGIIIKSETWNYNSGQTSVTKFWKLDTENWTGYDDSEYKKDSIWVYYDKKGDTLRIEKYKNDQLVENKEMKK
ncbi:hypothetical protein [Aequorivita antarctica]|uniref:Uncharacterized protein n=1 Tax=Aequorivita antarctica TaxID=153266 RepID=A0A5C6YYL5_9FLAO|nr:hypothetical protein [Aequorivita antarctica]TXD72141.1 hypothetical protein ESU54_13915 [Aequorivita antarctica]